MSPTLTHPSSLRWLLRGAPGVPSIGLQAAVATRAGQLGGPVAEDLLDQLVGLGPDGRWALDPTAGGRWPVLLAVVFASVHRDPRGRPEGVHSARLLGILDALDAGHTTGSDYPGLGPEAELLHAIGDMLDLGRGTGHGQLAQQIWSHPSASLRTGAGHGSGHVPGVGTELLAASLQHLQSPAEQSGAHDPWNADLPSCRARGQRHPDTCAKMAALVTVTDGHVPMVIRAELDLRYRDLVTAGRHRSEPAPRRITARGLLRDRLAARGHC